MSSEIMVVSSERTEIDMQIATAKQWPRIVKNSINRVIEMVLDDDDLALSCSYTIPRGGKTLSGPSVRLAELVASSWGNLRVKYEIVSITNDTITARGMAHDLESNFAASVDVQRSIMGSKGRFSQDMIIVTGNAAGAIALRNAIFKVVPRSHINKIEAAAKKSISEDKSKLPARVEKCLDQLAAMGVTEQDVLNKLHH